MVFRTRKNSGSQTAVLRATQLSPLPCSLWHEDFTSQNTFSENVLLLTGPLGCFLLFYPIVVGRVVPVVWEANPRACNANAGVTVVVITDPSSREVGCPPGLSKFAHHARCHCAVTLRRHICRISANRQDYKGTPKPPELLKKQ